MAPQNNSPSCPRARNILHVFNADPPASNSGSRSLKINQIPNIIHITGLITQKTNNLAYQDEAKCLIGQVMAKDHAETVLAGTYSSVPSLIIASIVSFGNSLCIFLCRLYFCSKKSESRRKL